MSSKLLTQTADDILTSKQVHVYENIIINGSSYKSDYVSSNYEFNTSTASATANVVLQNPNGKFSPEGTSEIREGDELIIEEGQYLTDGSLEVYSGFTGIISNPKVSKQVNNVVSIQAYDYVNRLLNSDIDYEKSGTKVAVVNETLTPHYLILDRNTGNYVSRREEVWTTIYSGNPLALYYFHLADEMAGTEAYYSGMAASTISDWNKNYYLGLATKYHLTEQNYLALANQYAAAGTTTTYVTSGALIDNYIEDTTQNWEDNELVGLYVFCDDGDVVPIQSNTATKIYVELKDWGSTSYNRHYAIGEGLAQVFDFNQENICEFPIPYIKIIDSGRTHPWWNFPAEVLTEFNGFSIKFDEGQLILNTPIDVTHKSVLAVYQYYSTGLWVEDILKDIVTTADTYGNVLDESTYLISKFSDESRATLDTMTCNLVPDTDPEVYTYLTMDMDEDEIPFMFVGSTAKFLTPAVGETAYLQVGTEIISYQDAPISTAFRQLTRGALGTVKQPHSQRDKVYQIYPVGQLWFTTYNNLTTDCTAGDFTITGGAFKSFSKRFGRLTLSTPISTSAIVTLNKDYSFYTLQATGVQVNEVQFSHAKYENRFSVINELRKFVAPNYIIHTRGDRKIWASYMNQNTVKDYELKLVKSLETESDIDTYTRVKLFAQNNNPTNVMSEHDIKIVQSRFWMGSGIGGYNSFHVDDNTFVDGELIGYNLFDQARNYFLIYGNTGHDLIVSGETYGPSYKIGRFFVDEIEGRVCKFIGQEGDYYVYDPGVGMYAEILPAYPDSPKVYINGAQLDAPEPTPIGPVPVMLEERETIISKETQTWGGTVDIDTSTKYKYLVYLPHTDIVSNIYRSSGGAINTANDIFIYLVGMDGGGMNASVQFFSQEGGVEFINEHRWDESLIRNIDISILDPLFTLPVDYRHMNYTKGIWAVKELPSYIVRKKALYEPIDEVQTTGIKILHQEWYVGSDETGWILAYKTYQRGYGTSGRVPDLSTDPEGGIGTWYISGIGNDPTPVDVTGAPISNSTIEDPTKMWLFDFFFQYSHRIDRPLNSVLGCQDANENLVGGSTDWMGTGTGADFANDLWGKNSSTFAAYKIAFFTPPKNIDDYGLICVNNAEIIKYSGLELKETIETMIRIPDAPNLTWQQFAGWETIPSGPDIGKTQRAVYKYVAIEPKLKVINYVYELGNVVRGMFGTTPQVFASFVDPSNFRMLEHFLNPCVAKQKKYNIFPIGDSSGTISDPVESIKSLGSAIYYVWHKPSGQPSFILDHSRNVFKILKSKFTKLVAGQDQPNDIVQADFKYGIRLVPISNYRYMFDGRYNTAAQQMFLIEPQFGTEVVVVDFGKQVDIDAIDLQAGFFSLSGSNYELRQIAITNHYSIQYSDDLLTWYYPCKKANAFSLASGQTFSLEHDDLQENFKCRYLRLVIEQCQRIDSADGGVWLVVISDFRAYSDTVLCADAKLLKRYDTGTGVGTLNTLTDSSKTWSVNQWAGYWLVDDNGQEFYIASNTSTALTVSGTPVNGVYYIFVVKESEANVYDKENLQITLKERIYKHTNIDATLKSKEQINADAKAYLEEYIKNHVKGSAKVMFHPAIRLGQTVHVTDSLNHIDRNYFVESVSKQGVEKTMVLGYYP